MYRWTEGYRPVELSVRDKKLTLRVGDGYLCRDQEMPYYERGQVLLGTSSTAYGPKQLNQVAEGAVGGGGGEVVRDSAPIRTSIPQPFAMSSPTATTKDFAPLRADYAFFETHATEAAEDLRAYAAHVRDLTAGAGPVRMLDFGC